MFPYVELLKPRVTLMVVLTTAISFYLASPGFSSDSGYLLLLAHTILGTIFLAGGCAVLNQYFEQNVDSRMRRTMGRPLPSGRVAPMAALCFGVGLTLGGSLYLIVWVNLITGMLGLVAALVYLFAYTPLKKKSPICTTVGAIPGAAPTLLGWTAARGTLDLEAWVLFAILFVWQYPHFLAISWVYREDYQRGGLQMLPQLDPDGRRTARQIVIFSLLLLPVSMLPAKVGLSGTVYMAGALVLGSFVLWSSLRVASTRSQSAALNLLRASVIYLPLVMALMALDRI